MTFVYNSTVISGYRNNACFYFVLETYTTSINDLDENKIVILIILMSFNRWESGH